MIVSNRAQSHTFRFSFSTNNDKPVIKKFRALLKLGGPFSLLGSLDFVHLRYVVVAPRDGDLVWTLGGSGLSVDDFIGVGTHCFLKSTFSHYSIT